MQSGVVVVDDRDPRIDYLTAWYNDVQGQGAGCNRTVSVSGNPNASFQFTFNGTSVSVYGSIPPNNTAVSTFIMDVAAPVSFTNEPSNVYSSRHLCYQSPTLPDGAHTLIVILPDSTIGEEWTQFYFDFLTYTPSTANSTASTSSTAVPTPTYASVTGAAAGDTTTQTAAASSNASKPALKTILPAVLVPCVVCIAVLLAALHFLRRRIRRTRKDERAPLPYLAPPSAEFAKRPYGSTRDSQPSTPSTPSIPTLPPHLASPPPSSSAPTSVLGSSPAPAPAPLTPLTSFPPSPSTYSDRMVDLSPTVGPVSQSLDAAVLGPHTGGDTLDRVREWRMQGGGGSLFAASVATEEPPPVYMP